MCVCTFIASLSLSLSHGRLCPPPGDSLRAEDPRAAEGDEYHTSFDESVALAREEERREQRVREMGNDPMIYTKLVQSVAPSIW